jgi:gliding motility-associated-like protein
MCISFFLSLQGIAQSTIGKEFLVGFMENNQKPTLPDKAVVIITANENVSGTLSFQGQLFPFSLTKGQIFKKEFLSTSQDVIHRTSEVVESKSLLVSASGNVAVYAYNTRQNSADATLILPINSLSKEYFVTAHFMPLSKGPDNSASTALVIANEDDTLVEITPSVGTEKGNPAKVPFTLTLNAGESYQIRALGDLTGTRVRILNSTPGDCKKLAVFGGNKMTTVADCGITGDHMYYQALPIENWGKSYIHIPLKNRTSGEEVKVLAGTDNTQVFVNGVNKGTLNKGEFLKLDFGVDEVANIETSYPSAVSLLSKSQDCNTSPGLIGDPFLMTYHSNEQRIKDINFYSVDEAGFIFNNANIIAPSSSLNLIRLNGIAITSQFKPVPGNPSFSYAQVNLKNGANTLTSQDGVLIYVYGSGQRSSYGYSAGFGGANDEIDVENDLGVETGNTWEVCAGKEYPWEVKTTNSQFVNFLWDFGDGTGTKSGKSINHAYQTAGEYQVKVTASTGTGSCAISKTLEFKVRVENFKAELIGPKAACVDTQITYFLKNGNDPVKGDWLEVIGGQIIEKQETQITVSWIKGFEIGKIRVVPMSSSGCKGEELVLEVEIGKGEFLPKPVGVSEICGTVDSPFVYDAPISSNQPYSWTVIGGEIVKGQGTSQVEVKWDFSLGKWEISYQVSNSGDCGSDSEILKLLALEPIVIQTVELKAPECPGEANGSLQIQINGGSGEYEILWNHDSQEKSKKVEGLSAGKYKVIAKDKKGCGSAELEIEISNPPGMKLVGELETTSIVCQGSATGSFKAKLSGGSPPFHMEELEYTWDGEYLEVSGLSKGPFSLFVLDSKGCSLSLQGQIEDTPSMMLTFVEQSPGCPGGDTGSLGVKVSGGAPPYSYHWGTGEGVAISSTLSFPSTILDQGPLINSLPSGEYSVLVTDSNGCSVMAFGKISESKPKVRMPTGFLPNEGPYEPVSNCYLNYKIQIFDRWGNLAYTGTEGWNGEIKGSEAPVGTYTYRLVYFYSLKGEELQEESQGVFTLIR